MLKVGPSGNSDIFYEQGYKHTYEAMKWLKDMGLNAYEYSFGRGVRIGEDSASKIAEAAKENGISMSVHAPYYINLATIEEEKKNNNMEYLLSSAKAAKMLGATRVIFHPGTCAKIDRDLAMELILKETVRALKLLDDNDLGDIALCPETMGKKNQVGSLEEVMEICKLDKRLIPTIDFGHLYARTLGGITCEDDFSKIMDTIENELSFERLSNMHCHFSKIEFTQSGEKKHLTFESTEFGPDPMQFAHQLALRKLNATIICESKGTMAQDALAIMNAYKEYYEE